MVRTSILLSCLSLARSSEAREPPAPQCGGAWCVVDAHQLEARTALLRTADGIRARAALASACPGLRRRRFALLAAGGWLCGGPHDTVVSQTQRCAVTAVEHIDGGDYAELRLRNRAAATLDAVVVRRRRAGGFAGFTDDCVRTRGLRSWQDGVGGVTVEVSPRRAGGHRYDRIETVGRCSEAGNADTLELVPGLENGMVCGHPGDRVVFRKLREVAEPAAVRGVAAAQGILQSGLAAPPGRQITRVYPVES